MSGFIKQGKSMSDMRSLAAPLRVLAMFCGVSASVLPGVAHAAIDYGNTIESVTTSSSSWSGQYGTSGSATTANIDAHAGVFDGKTGLQWVKASTLAEGQALGYRLATADEFRTFLTDKGWTAKSGMTDQWALTSGFSYGTSSSYNSPGASSGSSSTVTNLASVSFSPDASASTSGYLGAATLSVSLGWLDNGAGGTLAGAWFDRNDNGGGCSGGRSTYCSSVTAYKHDAAVASFADLPGGDYAAALAKVTPASVSYYMVASVPEPGTLTLMGLGLAGFLLVARRQRLVR